MLYMCKNLYLEKSANMPENSSAKKLVSAKYKTNSWFHIFIW